MVLKRKRSSDFSPASSTSSWSSSSTRASQSPTPHSRSYFQDAHSSMDVDRPIPSIPIAAWNLGVGRVSSTDMNSRTRKRFRDNRPDEEIIHENTLNKLFSAQKQHPHASPIPSQSMPPPPTTSARPSAPVQKSTLHSFWTIHQPAPPPTVVVHHAPEFEDPDRPRCDDCGSNLESGDVGMMDVDMMGDGGDSGCNPFACAGCRRRVCDMCAVVANDRSCLHCASLR